MNKQPPVSLVKTWAWMMTESDDEQVRNRAMNNLIAAFGTLAAAQAYISANMSV